MLLHEQAFQLIGEGVVLLVFLIVVILIIGLLLGIILVRRNKLVFPSVIIFIVNVFYSPLKSFANLLGLDDSFVDNMGIEVRNKVNKAKFEKIPPEEKIIVLPHCLRSAHCEASLKETGVQCTYCGKCAIGVIKEKAEPMGYRVFIVPGSSFVKKIIQQNREFFYPHQVVSRLKWMYQRFLKQSDILSIKDSRKSLRTANQSI